MVLDDLITQTNVFRLIWFSLAIVSAPWEMWKNWRQIAGEQDTTQRDAAIVPDTDASPNWLHIS